jgi:hypothetical protein
MPRSPAVQRRKETTVQTTYGARTETIPAGFYKRIHFPELMRLDVRTPDGRLFESAGAGVPILPETIQFLDEVTEGGHLGAKAVGRLDEITIHDDGLVSGWGLLQDTPLGRVAATAVEKKIVYKNSVHLRDVDLAVRFPNFPEPDAEGWMSIPTVEVNFRKHTIGATTLVMMPGFPRSSSEIVEDEVTASFQQWTAGPVELEELAASMAKQSDRIIMPWEDFHTPEFDDPKGLPLTVDEENRVFGHLGLWNSCHTGFVDRCVMIPQSMSGYASFNKSVVLTDRGNIRTGPIFLFGGHPQNAKPETVNAAYGGIENTWANVRVYDGKHGPWVSGRVRPGTSPEAVYAAAASRISGHWFDRELYATVSVNAEGFNVPFQYAQEDGHELLVASFATANCGCGSLDPMLELELMMLADDDD